MTLWEFIEKEEAKLKEYLHSQDLLERVWMCEPLLVVDADGEVVYEGNSNVDVTPLGHDRADLVAQLEIKGWRPSLVGAKVRGFSSGGGWSGGSRNGIICQGADPDGNIFTWYINGAADEHFAWILRSDELGVAPPEELLPKRFEPR